MSEAIAPTIRNQTDSDMETTTISWYSGPSTSSDLAETLLCWNVVVLLFASLVSLVEIQTGSCDLARSLANLSCQKAGFPIERSHEFKL